MMLAAPVASGSSYETNDRLSITLRPTAPNGKRTPYRPTDDPEQRKEED
jgi:hypothetical protein